VPSISPGHVIIRAMPFMAVKALLKQQDRGLTLFCTRINAPWHFRRTSWAPENRMPRPLEDLRYRLHRHRHSECGTATDLHNIHDRTPSVPLPRTNRGTACCQLQDSIISAVRLQGIAPPPQSGCCERNILHVGQSHNPGSSGIWSEQYVETAPDGVLATDWAANSYG
jgi:hypothetical protein